MTHFLENIIAETIERKVKQSHNFYHNLPYGEVWVWKKKCCSKPYTHGPTSNIFTDMHYGFLLRVVFFLPTRTMVSYYELYLVYLCLTWACGNTSHTHMVLLQQFLIQMLLFFKKQKKKKNILLSSSSHTHVVITRDCTVWKPIYIRLLYELRHHSGSNSKVKQKHLKTLWTTTTTRKTSSMAAV